MMAFGTLVAATAEDWIGVPFHWQGTIRAGCDCKGLVAGIARELGRPEADSLEALAGDYGAVIDAARLRRGLARLFDPAAGMEPGDVLLVRIDGKPQHLAIFAPRGPSGGRRVIEAMIKGPQQVRAYRRSSAEIDSAWRWREIGDG